MLHCRAHLYGNLNVPGLQVFVLSSDGQTTVDIAVIRCLICVCEQLVT